MSGSEGGNGKPAGIKRQGACFLPYNLLASREIENIFENSDFVYLLNQAPGDRQFIAKQLGISPHQLSYVTHSNAGEGLLIYGSVIIPFKDIFPKGEIYDLLTTKPGEAAAA